MRWVKALSRYLISSRSSLTWYSSIFEWWYQLIRHLPPIEFHCIWDHSRHEIAYWNLIPIFRLSTCRWSLALILWGFEVHTSTTTSQSDSFKLLLEMILWSIFYFARFCIFLGIFIWIDHHPSRQRFQHKCWTEIGERCAKLKSDIDLRSSFTSGTLLEVLRLTFWSSRNAWKCSKYGAK